MVLFTKYVCMVCLAIPADCKHAIVRLYVCMVDWWMTHVYMYTSAAYHISEAFIRAPASRTYPPLHTYIHMRVSGCSVI